MPKFEIGKDGVERKKITTMITKEAFEVIQDVMFKYGSSMGQAINIICLEKKKENDVIFTMSELLKQVDLAKMELEENKG